MVAGSDSEYLKRGNLTRRLRASTSFLAKNCYSMAKDSKAGMLYPRMRANVGGKGFLFVSEGTSPMGGQWLGQFMSRTWGGKSLSLPVPVKFDIVDFLSRT